MTIKAEQFNTAGEAMQHANAGGGEAVLVCGAGNLVTTEAECVRMAAAGVEFAYLCDHNGQIVTVPVN